MRSRQIIKERGIYYHRFYKLIMKSYSCSAKSFYLHLFMSSIILLSTINQLLDEIKYLDHVSKLESAVQYLYTSFKRAISNHVYGNWEPMINELLVCAAIIC